MFQKPASFRFTRRVRPPREANHPLIAKALRVIATRLGGL